MANTYVVKAALWRYTDRHGSRRIARFGDTVELTAAEAKRGEDAGVFDPAPVPAVASDAVERALAGIESRMVPPIAVGDDADLPLHHDVTNRDQQIGQAAMADFLTKDPAELVTGDGHSTPAAAQAPQGDADSGSGGNDTGDSTPADTEPLKRPAKAASVDVWRAYIAAVKPELADEVAGMGKVELQAQAPKDD